MLLSQLDEDRTLTDQLEELPYVMSFEFDRERVRFVKELGSGEFGEVWLAQALEISKLNPRDQSEEAVTARHNLRGAKKIGREFDKRIKTGRNVELAAIKRLKGIVQ